MTRPLTRKELLERAALGGAALTVPGFLAACGGGSESAATTAATTGADPSLADKLTMSNWPFYIDRDEQKKSPTLEQFTQETEVAVDYIEDIEDNDSWFEKNEAKLDAGEPIGRDITVLTDWMAARMVRRGYVERLDKSLIPNEANLITALRGTSWDPDRAYSLPWQSGLTGIGFDSDKVGTISSVQQLLEEPRLKGKVSFLRQMTDTMGLLLHLDGADPANVQPAAFDKSLARLQKAVDAGQIREFTGNEYRSLLAKGELWAAMAFSGDMVQLQADNPKLRFLVPVEGGMIWTDNMLVPTGGNVPTASTFMNFVYRPEVAAQIAADVHFICPVDGAQLAMQDTDPVLATNQLIFPSGPTLTSVEQFDPVAADNPKYNEQFQAVIRS